MASTKVAGEGSLQGPHTRVVSSSFNWILTSLQFLARRSDEAGRLQAQLRSRRGPVLRCFSAKLPVCPAPGLCCKPAAGAGGSRGSKHNDVSFLFRFGRARLLVPSIAVLLHKDLLSHRDLDLSGCEESFSATEVLVTVSKACTSVQILQVQLLRRASCIKQNLSWIAAQTSSRLWTAVCRIFHESDQCRR